MNKQISIQKEENMGLTNFVANTNCPKCIYGVLEELGFISLDRLMEINELEEKNNELGICLYLCSLDECGYSEMRSVPGTLSTAKRIKRQQLVKFVG